jgi:IS30 family transposase
MFKYQQLQPEERLPRHCGRATYDQDKEMSRHKELTAAAGMKMYFCDPQNP